MSLMRVTRVPRMLVERMNDGGDGTPAATTTAGAGTTDVEVNIWWVVVPVIVVAVAWLAIVNFRTLPPAPKVADGFSALALFYVAAQIIERGLEPFTNVVLPTGKVRKELAAAVATALNDPTPGAAGTAADKQNDLDRKRAERAILFWAIASVIGMAASAWMGLYFVNALLAEGSGIQTTIDVLITGLLIGSGSKPLHDLISRIESKKDEENDPPETNS